MEQAALNYEIETKIIIFQGKQVTLTNRTPVFTSEQREKQRRVIEQRLFAVVKKHKQHA
ncbi:MAG: hypothetical protein FWD19_00485 [Defluviitaleaceae bacterium]|nr:hypothetical protein [Defluviitaleaceae bacterium]